MLVDHAEASLVANAISQVARNPGQAQSMSQAARQTVVDRFSTESCIAELESCYREAMVHG
jgi:glycosyltransferase involved in cell wall biosynthesis